MKCLYAEELQIDLELTPGDENIASCFTVNVEVRVLECLKLTLNTSAQMGNIKNLS